MTGPRKGWPARMRAAVSALLGGVAGALLVLMMMVTVVDVVGRYFLNAPLPGGFELTQFLMAAIVYAGLPRVSDRDGQITIDLLDSVTPGRVRPVRDLLIQLICMGFFAILAYRLWVLAGEAMEWGDITQYLRWPLAPIIYFGSAMFAVAAVVYMGKVFAILRGAAPDRGEGAAP
jgi:TRAP-type C4-dicarboxylate transport system permease small subunit